MAANFASFMEFCSSIYLVYYGVLAFTFASFMELSLIITSQEEMEVFVSCLSADGSAKIFMKYKQKNVWPGDCKMNFTICFKQSYFFLKMKWKRN